MCDRCLLLSCKVMTYVGLLLCMCSVVFHNLAYEGYRYIVMCCVVLLAALWDLDKFRVFGCIVAYLLYVL